MPNPTSSVTILAVGVEQYPDSPLSGPGRDVANLRSLLVEDLETALYQQNQFIELIDPTTIALRQVLNDYVYSRSAAGDILVLYFSGHGVPIGTDDFGLCMIDTVWHPLEEMVLPMTVVRFSEILETLLVGNVTPVVIIDACYSGIAARKLNIASSQLLGNLPREVQKENASKYALLCSCASHQTSIDTPIGGIFSHYLIEAARRGVPNGTRRTPTLTLADIFPELDARVGSYTGDSAPRLYLGDTLPEFPLVKNIQFRHQRISFTPYMAKIINALWNNGNDRPLSLAQSDRICGKGAYGNHRKLSLEQWRLVEDVPGTRKKRRLTDRGRAFVQGNLRVTKAMIKDPLSNNYVAEPGASEVTFAEVR